MLTAEQLQKYWDANPAALEQAIQSNPTAFGLSASGMLAPATNGMGDDGYQLGAFNSQTGTYQDINTGVPNLGQREPPTGDFLSQFNDLNTRYTDVFTNANQTATDLMTPSLESQEWQDFIKSYTETGGNVPQELLPASTPFEALEGYAPTADYRSELDELLQASGMSPVKEEDGKLFAIRTGKENGFTDLTYVPPGYQFKSDGVAGEYGELERIPENTSFNIVKGLVNAGTGALLGAGLSPVLGATGAGAVGGGTSAAVGGGDLEDIARGALTGGALAGLGEYLAPTPTAGTAPAGGLSNEASGLFDKATSLLRSQNPVGSFARGSITSAVGQAIINGEISIEDALKAGLITAGVDTVKDAFGDTRQTNDGNLIEGIDKLDGQFMTAEDIERLTNTTDLYGLLGENGLLSKIGLDVGYLPTDWAGDSLSLIDEVFGSNLQSRPIIDPTGAAAQQLRDDIEAIEADRLAENKRNFDLYNNGELSYNELLQANINGMDIARGQFKSAEDSFLSNTQRYDERYFDISTQRDPNAPLQGIYEENPYAHQGTTWTGFPAAGSEGTSAPASAPITVGVNEDVAPATQEGMLSGQQTTESVTEQTTPPSTGTGTTVGVDTTETTLPDEEVEQAEVIEEQEEEEQVEEELEANEDALGVVEDLTDVSEDELQDVVEAVEEGELTLGAPPGWGDTQLPSGGTDTELPTVVSGGDTELPGVDPGDELQYNPDGSIFNWTTNEYEVFPGTENTTVTSGGGGAAGGGIGAAALAAGIGGDDFKKFMAGIDYVVPVLQALNIPFEDYMAMWIQGNKA